MAVGELLEALTSTGRGFRAGLGAGLNSWAEMVPQGEWGRIRVTWEEASKEEYEYRIALNIINEFLVAQACGETKSPPGGYPPFAY